MTLRSATYQKMVRLGDRTAKGAREYTPMNFRKVTSAQSGSPELGALPEVKPESRD